MNDRQKIRFVRRLTEAPMTACVKALRQTGGNEVEAAKLLRTPEQNMRNRAWLRARSIVPDVDGGVPSQKEIALQEALEQPLKPLAQLDPVPQGYPRRWIEALQKAAVEGRDDTLLVFADWLQEHGDPRGELIALQHLRGDQQQTATERQLVRVRAEDLVGEIINERWSTSIEWHLGFVRHLHTALLDHGDTWAEQWFAELSRFVDHPSCSLLRSLSIGWIGQTTEAYERILHAISARVPSTLDTLVIGDPRSTCTLGSLDVLSSFASLKRLTIRGRYGHRIWTRPHTLGNHITELTLGLEQAAIQHVLQQDWATVQQLRIELSLAPDLLVDWRAFVNQLITSMPGLRRFELREFGAAMNHLLTDTPPLLGKLHGALREAYPDLGISFRAR